MLRWVVVAELPGYLWLRASEIIHPIRRDHNVQAAPVAIKEDIYLYDGNASGRISGHNLSPSLVNISPVGRVYRPPQLSGRSVFRTQREMVEQCCPAQGRGCLR